MTVNPNLCKEIEERASLYTMFRVLSVTYTMKRKTQNPLPTPMWNKNFVAGDYGVMFPNQTIPLAPSEELLINAEKRQAWALQQTGAKRFNLMSRTVTKHVVNKQMKSVNYPSCWH